MSSQQKLVLMISLFLVGGISLMGYISGNNIIPFLLVGSIFISLIMFLTSETVVNKFNIVLAKYGLFNMISIILYTIGLLVNIVKYYQYKPDKIGGNIFIIFLCSILYFLYHSASKKSFFGLIFMLPALVTIISTPYLLTNSNSGYGILLILIIIILYIVIILYDLNNYMREHKIGIIKIK